MTKFMIVLIKKDKNTEGVLLFKNMYFVLLSVLDFYLKVSEALFFLN